MASQPGDPGASQGAMTVHTGRHAPIVIGDQTLRSKADIVTYIESLPAPEQYGAQRIIGSKLIEVQTRHEDLIFDFYEYIEQSRAYHYVNRSRQQFLADNEILVNEVKSIKKKRDVRMESLKRLTQHLTSERGLALLATIQADGAISGKNFIADLATIFSRVGTREGIARLNAAILARNRRPRTRGMRPRTGAMPADAATVKASIAAGESWGEEDLSLQELKRLSLRYGASGLLEEGEATAEIRPAFADERRRDPRMSSSQGALQPAGVERSTAEPHSSPDPRPAVGDGSTATPGELRPPITPGLAAQQGSKRPPLTPDSPGPAQKRSRAAASARDPPILPARGVNTSACDCTMAAAWKNSVEHPDPKEGFTQLREKIRPVAEAQAGDDRPCAWHLGRLYDQLRLKTEALSTATMIQRLKEVWEVSRGERDNIRVVSSGRTRGYFVECQELRDIRDRHSLGVLRFAPVVPTVPAVSKRAYALRGAPVDAVEALRAEDFASLAGVYSWIFKRDAVLTRVFLQEARMYQYHSRDAPRRDGLVRNMYHSLFQQLVRQDPALYDLHVNLRGDDETRLVAFPQCARFFDAGATVDSVTYEGDTDRIRRGTSHAIRDEIILTDGGPADSMQVLPASAELVRRWLDESGETQESIDLGPPTALVQSHDRWRDVEMESGTLVLMRSGTPLRYHFRSATPQLSVTSGLVAVSRDDPRLLENGAALADIVQSHRKMTTPGRLRFLREPGAHDHIPGRFPPAVELCDLGAISNALVGRMDWDSPAVERDRTLVLTGSKKDVNAYYTNWRAQARARVIACWKMVEERERNFYGEKSFFYRDGAAPPQADDEVFSPLSAEPGTPATGDGLSSGEEGGGEDEVGGQGHGGTGHGE